MNEHMDWNAAMEARAAADAATSAARWAKIAAAISALALLIVAFELFR